MSWHSLVWTKSERTFILIIHSFSFGMAWLESCTVQTFWTLNWNRQIDKICETVESQPFTDCAVKWIYNTHRHGHAYEISFGSFYRPNQYTYSTWRGIRLQQINKCVCVSVCMCVLLMHIIFLGKNHRHHYSKYIS